MKPANQISETEQKVRPKQIFKKAIGYFLAAICLVWVFHDVQFDRLIQEMRSMEAGWILPAVFFDILSYFSQGLRWQLLLHPLGRLSGLRTTQAVYAGLFTNEILPLRVGELVRSYLVSRWLSVQFLKIVPSIMIERLFDGIWLGIGIGVTALFIHLPTDIIDAAEIMGVVVLIGIGLFVFFIFKKEKTLNKQHHGSSLKWKPLVSIRKFLDQIANEIRRIGLSGYFYSSFFASAFILIFQIIAFWLVMIAYHLEVSLWISAVVLLIVHFGTALPNAPSNVGTYQFFCVVGLTLFGIDKTTATGFSVVVFILLTIPLWLIGLMAIKYSGMTLKMIQDDINRTVLHKDSH
jgi:uncharacterized protein (TIRG00374 family)